MLIQKPKKKGGYRASQCFLTCAKKFRFVDQKLVDSSAYCKHWGTGSAQGSERVREALVGVTLTTEPNSPWGQKKIRNRITLFLGIRILFIFLGIGSQYKSNIQHFINI